MFCQIDYYYARQFPSSHSLKFYKFFPVANEFRRIAMLLRFRIILISVLVFPSDCDIYIFTAKLPYFIVIQKCYKIPAEKNSLYNNKSI